MGLFTRLLEARGLSMLDLENNTRTVLGSSMYKIDPYGYRFEHINFNFSPRFKYASFDAIVFNKDTQRHYRTSIFFYNVVDTTVDSRPDLARNPVRVSCSCPAYYFYFSYWNKMGAAHARRPLRGYVRKTPPPPEGLPYKNPMHLPGACKHILAFANYLNDADYNMGEAGVFQAVSRNTGRWDDTRPNPNKPNVEVPDGNV